MFELWDSAECTYFLGIKVYGYGLYVMYGLALMLLVMFLHGRKRYPAGTLALMGCLMIPCGFLLSRLFCLLLDARARQWPFFRAFFMMTAGGGSMFGALFGGLIGLLAACRIMKFDSKLRLRAMDIFAVAALLFVALARMGEGFIEDFGISFPLSSRAEGMFIINGDYADYLAVYKLESLYALVLFVVFEMQIRRKQPGVTFFTAVLLFSAGQILFESFREDGHMAFSFVGAQHLLAAGCLGAAVVYFALKGRKALCGKALPTAALISLPLMVGILVGLEFALDRTDMSRVLLYIVYVIVIACPCALALILRRRAEKAA